MTGEIEDAILTVVAEAGPVTGPEIAGALGVHPSTVRRHCQRLQRAGRIKQHLGGGYVTVTESGRPSAAD
ncbi:HTH domain-containing protein [Halovenus sp. HT40]|uniref:HTH domain-containing protein n=1 Tax=Halovenus sp. HT40 TaxID=3126691 RepID=UPI00300EF7CE